MQNLEGSGTPVLYIGRTVPEVKGHMSINVDNVEITCSRNNKAPIFQMLH
jgi:hypothetical protein